MYKSSIEGTLCVCVSVILSMFVFRVRHYTKKGGNFFFSITLGAADGPYMAPVDHSATFIALH